MKDLTNSTIERQNILNNKFALQHVQEYVGIEEMMFEGEFKFMKKMAILIRGKALKELTMQFTPVIPENVIDHVYDDIDGVLLLNEQKAVLAFCNKPQISRDILRHVNVAYHPDALKLYIRALVNNGCLQMTMPDKPTSKNQHYFTTEKGKRLLSKKD